MNDQNPYAAPQVRSNASDPLQSATTARASLRNFHRAAALLLLLYSPLGLGLFLLLGFQGWFFLMPVVQLLGLLSVSALFWWRPAGISPWWFAGAASCQALAMMFAWVCAYLDAHDTETAATRMGFMSLGAQILAGVLLQAGSSQAAQVFALSSLKYCVRRALILTGVCLFFSALTLATDMKNFKHINDVAAPAASLTMLAAYLFHCLTLFFLWRSEPLVLLQLQRLAPHDFPSLPQAQDAFLTDLSRIEAESSQ